MQTSDRLVLPAEMLPLRAPTATRRNMAMPMDELMPNQKWSTWVFGVGGRKGEKK